MHYVHHCDPFVTHGRTAGSAEDFGGDARRILLERFYRVLAVEATDIGRGPVALFTAPSPRARSRGIVDDDPPAAPHGQP